MKVAALSPCGLSRMANPTDDSSWKWYGDPAASGAVNSPVMAGRPPIRAVVFDAGHTLLEMDYARLTAYLVSRGHALGEARVTEAERRARMRLDVERAAQSSRVRTGEGRYVRYLVEYLGIVDDVERTAIAEWRRGFNAPIGLCHQADGEAAKALQHARDMGLVVGVISNSNGSVQRALDIAGSPRISSSSSTRAWLVSRSRIPGSSSSVHGRRAPHRKKSSTSAIRTSSTWSVPAGRDLGPCCSIRVACGARATARSRPACARRSSRRWIKPQGVRAERRHGRQP
jgi:hypothetical protein